MKEFPFNTNPKLNIKLFIPQKRIKNYTHNSTLEKFPFQTNSNSEKTTYPIRTMKKLHHRRKRQ